MLNRLGQAWSNLRRRPRLALVFDVGLLIIALLLIDRWNSRDLPVAQAMPALPETFLDQAAPAASPMEGVGVVYFFAPWCSYCRHSIDNLDRLVASGRLNWARAVALDYDSVDAVQAFVQDTGLQQPVLLGDRETARLWHIQAYPSYFVIDANGQIDSRSVGYSTWAGMWARAGLAAD